jgi:hypothetical protein
VGWRFRRSLRIAPGLHLNIGKRGISSLSVGGRGARMTFGKRGVRQTVGLSGTGLSFSSTNRRGSLRVNSQAVTGASDLPFVDPERFGIKAEPIAPGAGRTRRTLFIVGGVTIAAGVLPVPSEVRPWLLLAGGVLFVLGLTRPSRASLEATEQHRIQNLARTELARRVSTFAAAVASLSTTQALSIDVKRVLGMQHELGLTDLEVARYQREKLQGIDALLEFKASCGDALVAIPGHEQVVAPDTCFFACAAVYDKRGDDDPSGTLYLTDARALFVSTDGVTTAAWRQVLSVDLDGRTLRVQRRDRQNPYLFALSTYADAMKAEFIAKKALGLVAAPPRQEEKAELPEQVSERAKATAFHQPLKHAVRIDQLGLDDEHHCDLGTGQRYAMAIVGESYRQTALRELSAGRRLRGEEVRFIAAVTPEPMNSYDTSAVRIDILNGAHIGYLAREDAVAYALALKAVNATGKQGVCRARLIGGTPDKPSIGVQLDLHDPETLIARFSTGGPF